MENKRLTNVFFERDVLHVAPDLLGKIVVRRFDNGNELRFPIIETEAYRGEEDLACHAAKGRTNRTEIMYERGGKVYVYLIYGMYWMLNFVTGNIDNPQAVLIRSVEGVAGPGRLGRILQLDKSFYGENLATSKRFWIEDAPNKPFQTATRIGIDYAGEIWKNKPWRFIQKMDVGKTHCSRMS